VVWQLLHFYLAFEDHGYEFDTGIHYIGNMHKRKAILDLICDKPIEWVQQGEEAGDYVYDEICIEGDMYKFRAGKQNFIDDLVKQFPEEEDGIKKYVELVQQVANKDLFFLLKVMKPVWLAKFVGRYFCDDYYRYIDLTTKEVVDNLIKNRRLRAVLCGQFGDVGQLPSESSFFMHASIANHYLEGGWYPIGGSSVFANNIIPTIEKAGGRVLTKARVNKILTSYVGNNFMVFGVEMEDGLTIRAEQVVSAVGIKNTYHNLLQNFVPDKLFDVANETPQSCSFVYMFVGIKGTAKELGLRSSNIWSLPNEDFDKLYEEFYVNPESGPMPMFIGFPSAKDPTYNDRHPGKSCADVLTTAKYEWFGLWEDMNHKDRKKNKYYMDYKEFFKKRMLEELLKYYPQLEDHIDYIDIGTPLTFNKYIGTTRGECYGLEGTKERYKNLDIRPETGVDNLYITGQDLTTLGFTGALMSAVLTVSSMLEYGNVLDVLSGRNFIEDLRRLED
jgi:all-trans-retinol 13,14-reductase